MSTVSDSIPSLSITSWACSRLSGEDVRYGIRTPISLSFPNASTARNAVSDESTPPDSPTIPFAIRNPQSAIHVVGRGVEEGDPLAIDVELARRRSRADLLPPPPPL